MTKRILGIMLTVALVLTVVVIPSTVTVSASETTPAYMTDFFVQDFEDIESNNWATKTSGGSGSVIILEDQNGNHFAELKMISDAKNYEIFNTVNDMLSPEASSGKWTFSMDVMKLDDGLPIGIEFYTEYSKNGIAFDSTNFEEGVWYNVAFAKDAPTTTAIVTNLETGETIRRHYHQYNQLGSVWDIGNLSAMKNTFRLIFSNSARAHSAIPEGHTMTDTHYYVDNIRFFEGAIADDVNFEKNGDSLTATMKVTSDSFRRYVAGRTTEVTTLLTAYDENNNMLASSVTTHNIEGEAPQNANDLTETNVTWRATKEVSDSLDLSGMDAARIEMTLLDGEELKRPISRVFTDGDVSKAESSETTANMGSTTDVTEREFDFVNLDRSTLANEVTVEGKVNTDAETEILIWAEGENSGNPIFVKQFTTAEDGSFKYTFSANPELFADSDNGLKVTLWGAKVNPKTLDITVGSQWEDFGTVFETINDGESAKAFYNHYASNLTYYKSGESDATTVDTDGLTDDDWTNLAFLISLGSYEDMTFSQIIAEADRLVAATRKISGFMESVNNAKNSDSTDEQKAESIRDILAGEDAPLEFNYGAASNVLAVCTELVDCEDFGSIQELYSIFKDITETQGKLEESALSGFKAINSAESAKAFFSGENGITLGITAETLGYADKDWLVFFEGYSDNGCSVVETSEEMSEALTKLRQYVLDVNAFVAGADAVSDIDAAKALFEGTYSTENYFGKKIAEIRNDGMNTDGIGNADFFYAELLTALDAENACIDLEAVVFAYKSAKVAEINFENTAVAALGDAVTKTAATDFIAKYADVLGLPDAKNLTERQTIIFAEINESRQTALSGYSDAVAELGTLNGLVVEAEAVLDQMKTAALAEDWETLMTLVEGKSLDDVTVWERYAENVDTSAITDKRALYLRLAKGGFTKEEEVKTYIDFTFNSIVSVADPFDWAYDTQLEWEQNTGAYESTDQSLANFDDSAWGFEVMANVVKVTGKVDKTGAHRLVFAVMIGDAPIMVKQIQTQPTGDFTVNLILNPDTNKVPGYLAGEDIGFVRIISDTVNSYKLPVFDLYSEETLTAILKDFKAIGDKSGESAQVKAIEDFVEKYGDILNISEKIENAIGGEEENTEKVFSAMVFVYNKYKDSYDGLEDVTDVVNGTDGKSGADAIVREMEKIVELLDKMTEAANTSVGSTVGKWGVIRDLVNEAEDNGWITLEGSTKGLSDKQIKALYQDMAGTNYNRLSVIEERYEKALDEVKKEAENNKNNGTGGGGGGGGFGGGKVTNVSMSTDFGTEDGKTEISPEDLPATPFTDIEDTVWAKDAITTLRRYAIVKGDGNGLFRPNATITREEFLAMLLRLFEIEVNNAGAYTFTDVESGAWYVDTVATAYSMGIVKGYGDGKFGIGDSITRADMAIMIYRMCEVQGVSLAAVEKAILFNDYDKIPEYAYEQIGILQQADIINGDDKGNFNAVNPVTRAEAAVALNGVFGKIKNLINYSWASKTY